LKKLEAERRAKDELSHRIAHEERSLKHLLQDRIERLQRDKLASGAEREMAGEYHVNKLNTLMSRLVREK
jgi:hypothetical protein